MAFWMCPSCGRKVPAYSANCHCGVAREAASQLAQQPMPAPGPVRFRAADVPRPAWVALGIIVLALLVGLWSLFQPPPPNTIPPLLGYRERGAPPPPPPTPHRALPPRRVDRPIVIMTPMPVTDERK